MRISRSAIPRNFTEVLVLLHQKNMRYGQSLGAGVGKEKNQTRVC